MNEHVYPQEFESMISAEAIRARIQELGQELTDLYQGDDTPLALVGVLKGSMPFMADLAREIRRPLTMDFLRVSSYEGTRSTGVVRFDFDLTQPIRDKHVLIIEDIIDTGLTMSFLLETLHLRKPASIKVVTLLDKPDGRRTEVPVDFVGFTIPNRFVLGYGLDLDGLYRNLPEVLAKREDA